MLWGSAIGAAAAYKTVPMVKDLQHSFRLFRKPWMRYPIQLSTFAFAYYCGSQLPNRILVKFSKNYKGVNDEYY